MADEKDDTIVISPSVPQPHVAPLLEGFQRLYASKDYADVTITFQGHEFKAHKVCLCPQSEYLQHLLGGTFKEAQDGKVAADDDDPQIIKALRYYLYFFNYEEHTKRYTDVAPIVLDVKMQAIADKYFVGPLEKLSAAKTEARAKDDWAKAAFDDGVAEIYQTTFKDEEPIRMIALATIRSHSNDLLNKKGKHAAFLKVLYATAELGGDLATSLIDPG